jgi:hypothetical protein
VSKRRTTEWPDLADPKDLYLVSEPAAGKRRQQVRPHMADAGEKGRDPIGLPAGSDMDGRCGQQTAERSGTGTAYAALMLAMNRRLENS